MSLVTCLEAGASVAETAADVSVWIPTQLGRIVCPHRLSLLCVRYQAVALQKRFPHSPRGQNMHQVSGAGLAAAGVQGVYREF